MTYDDSQSLAYRRLNLKRYAIAHDLIAFLQKLEQLPCKGGECDGEHRCHRHGPVTDRLIRMRRKQLGGS